MTQLLFSFSDHAESRLINKILITPSGRIMCFIGFNSQPWNGQNFHPYPQIMAVDYRFLPDLLLLSGWLLGSHVEHFFLDVGRSPAQVSSFFFRINSIFLKYRLIIFNYQYRRIWTEIQHDSMYCLCRNICENVSIKCWIKRTFRKWLTCTYQCFQFR